MTDWNDLPHDFTIRPIDEWPGKRTVSPTFSPFKAGMRQTLSTLRTELHQIGATQTILQLAIREGDLRLDGRPRLQARADHPGVILAFGSKYGPLKYATDRFTTWQDNLRAIALALEALRKVDRYGVSTRGEQYRGWAALPAPGASKASAEAWLREHGCASVTEALKRYHPDNPDTGDRALFDRAMQVKAALS